MAYFSPIGAESLTVDQTSQLRLEISLIGSICNRNYVIPLQALKNHVFSMFRPYSALIWPTSGQSGMKA